MSGVRFIFLLFDSHDLDRCSAVENLVQTLTQEPLESEQVQMLVQCLHAIFAYDLTTTPLVGTNLSQE